MIDLSNEESCLRVEQLLQALLSKFIDSLDTETLETVQHYLKHSEYEMAFEGLFIELIKLEVDLSGYEIKTYFNLGKDLGLDQDSVFEVDFWTNFKRFMGHN